MAQPPYVQPPYVQPPYVQPPYVQPPYVQPPYVQPPNIPPYVPPPYDRGRTEARLAYEATHDLLTGLPTRGPLVGHLTEALARSRREGTSVSVLFIDVDRFRVVNHTLGRAVGDLVLVGVARAIQRCLRPSDTCARVGADEFVVLHENSLLPSDGSILASRLRVELRAGVHADERLIPVRASIGLAVSSRDSSAMELLEEADAAAHAPGHDVLPWELEHQRGQRWAIVNRTGRVAVAVRIEARGSLLIFGTRDWSNTVDRWPDGVRVELMAQTTWRRSDPPVLRIFWSAEDAPDDHHLTTLPWP